MGTMRDRQVISQGKDEEEFRAHFIHEKFWMDDTTPEAAMSLHLASRTREDVSFVFYLL